MRRPLWLTRQNIVLSIISIALIGGAFETIRELTALHARRALQPYSFGGDIFAGVKGASGQEKYIGYITDRDIKNDKVSARFTQAQFTLAPVILDFNNINHRLLILDFQDLKQAAALGEKMKLRLLKRSPQGLLFAERLDL